jgi:O-antigen/teichoic acid export membrane protein
MQIAQLVTFVVVGRMLGPEAIGIIGLALLYFLLIYHLLADSLTEAIVQRPTLEPSHVESAFWVLAGIGGTFAAITWSISGIYARLFDTPPLADVLAWLSLGFIFFGPNSALICRLQRDMRFRALAVRGLVVNFTASACAIALAVQGFGIWSLVAYQLLLRSLELVVLIVLAGGVPRPRCSLRHLREIAPLGLNVAGFRAVTYVANQIERAVVGYVLGPHAFGLYTMARRVIDAAVLGATGAINLVLFAALSRLQHDRTAFARTLHQAAIAGRYIVMPAMVGLALVAPELIDAALTHDWHPMARVMSVLAIWGILFSEMYFLGTGLRALGRADMILRFTLIVAPVQGLLCALVVNQGIEAVAWALLATGAAALFPFIIMSRSVLALDLRLYVLGYLRPLAAVVVMAGVVAVARSALPAELTSASRLVILAFVGCAVYLPIAAATAPPWLRPSLPSLRWGRRERHHHAR